MMERRRVLGFEWVAPAGPYPAGGLVRDARTVVAAGRMECKETVGGQGDAR